MSTFDLIVLGTGTAGQHAAYKARDAGWSVAMTDIAPPGGTCANRGCDAKKPLVNAAAAFAQARRFAGRGIEQPGRIDWPSLMRFKASFTDPVPDNTRDDLQKAGIELYEQAAAFIDDNRLRIGNETIEADRIVIATGAKPRPLDIPGESLLTSSDAFLSLPTLPDRIVFVGGGYISMEFAHVAARAGATCIVAQRESRILPALDGDLTEALRQASQAAGIEVRCDTCITKVTRADNGKLIARCDKTDWQTEADMVVHGAGRVASFDGLNLDAADIDHDTNGIHVDQYFRSVSNRAVYACGDAAATSSLKLTPIANIESHAMTHNLLHGDERTADDAGVATVVFTDPPLASVGLNEAQAREQGIEVRVKHGDASSWKINRQQGAEHAAYKTLVERDSGRIIGAHLLGPAAEETINLFALAIRMRLTADQLKRVPYAYPTQTSRMGAMLP